MFIPRYLLKFALGILSRWAIKKHQIEMIVITGWYGTEIARELLYTIMSPNLLVRRNTEQIWWDFSIPLAVLGYKDKRRNILSWFFLLVKAFIYLLFGKKNTHILILNTDCTFAATARFWSSFIKPEYLLVLNYQKKSELAEGLINKTIRHQGTVVFNPYETGTKFRDLLKKANTSTFSLSGEADLTIREKKQNFFIKYHGMEISLPKNYFPAVSPEIISGVYSLALLKGLDLYEIGYNSLKFSLPPLIISKIKQNLAYN